MKVFFSVMEPKNIEGYHSPQVRVNLQLVHSDLSGIFSITSLGGYLYCASNEFNDYCREVGIKRETTTT